MSNNNCFKCKHFTYKLMPNGYHYACRKKHDCTLWSEEQCEDFEEWRKKNEQGYYIQTGCN